MTMTDPIADMLTRVRNANIAQHDDVVMPSSKLKEGPRRPAEGRGLHRRLQDARSPGQARQDAGDRHEVLARARRTISGIKRVSKPGLRVYKKSGEIPRVLGGLGVAVLSTSQGLMTDREARRRHVGGEILCYVW